MHTTLPRRFYADPDFYRAELQRFYFNRWICAGRADAIPRAGDYFTRTIGDESLIITRSGSGEIHALFNVCRHRGTRLCDAAEGHLDRSHPVPVSQLDLRSRRAAARRTAHGAGVLQGRLSPAPRRLRDLGGQHLRPPRRRVIASEHPCRPPHLPCAISWPTCPRGSPAGRWATCAWDGGSSTTSKRTGS